MPGKDIRTHRLKEQTIEIHIELVVVSEGETPGFLPNLSDELAAVLTKRMEDSTAVVHLSTPTWDVSMQ